MVTAPDSWSKWKERVVSFASAPVSDEPPVADRIREHERTEEARLAAHLEACGVPRRDVELLAGAERLKDTAAVVGVREWLRSGKTFLLLAGGVGTGKTVAASAVLKMARKAVFFMGAEGPAQSWSYSRSAGLFVRAAELASTSPYAEEGRGHWARVRRVQWLVLDDLGMERMDNAGIWAEQFDLLMDARYSERRKTVLTTNLASEDFVSRYMARAMDRVLHDGAVVLCGSESLRRAP